VAKTRLVRLGGKGLTGARAHLRYIQRDGVTRDGQPGPLYSAGDDVGDGRAFLERCDGDRHQFRFIVSAEDADQYQDLKSFVRRLMTQMEADLATRLDWVAVDHFNTGHPHTHIMLHGKDDRDQNLVIACEYIGQGIRERAAELVTLDLGPRTDFEIETRLRIISARNG
jgi:type IV secretory pathway VirD2 relaxase